MLELYQAEWCPYSRRVRMRLTELGVDFVVRQVEARSADREAMRDRDGARLDPGARAGGRRGDRRLQGDPRAGSTSTTRRRRRPSRTASRSSATGSSRRAATRSSGQPSGRLRQNRIREHRPRVPRPLAELAVGEHAEREARLGIDPEERPGRAEVAERRRRVARARPVRLLAVAHLERRAPSRSRSCRPKPGSTPTRPGKTTEVASSSVSARDERRLEQLAAEREQVAQRPCEPPRGRALQRRAQPERREHRLREVRGERHLRPLLDDARERLEARVGVDPPPAGLRHRRPVVERQPRRVREQVPDGRAGRPRGVLELDRPLLERDERRERGHRLRHGRPAKARLRVPVHGQDAAASDTPAAAARASQPSICLSASTRPRY